jgi:hypothetical protein
MQLNGMDRRRARGEVRDIDNQTGYPDRIDACRFEKPSCFLFRLFSFISLTWKGQPLINYETVVNLIGATTTKSGLRVKAVLDTNEYETGVKVSNSQMEELSLRRHTTHPDWNYTLEPRV